MPTPTEVWIEVHEGAPPRPLPLTFEAATAIDRLKIGTVTPSVDGWQLTGIRKIGSIRLGEATLRIHPKAPIDRLFWLLAHGGGGGEWFDDDISLDEVDDLTTAIADIFGRRSERILDRGILQGYRERRVTEPAIRGRWLVTEQVSRRYGMPLPAELRVDDFTTDIPENRLLRSAAIRLLALDALPVASRSRLIRTERRLGDVPPLKAGLPLPVITMDRRNERYRPALALARLILGGGSLEYHGGATDASGFLLNMAKVFEDFVERSIARAAGPFGGEIVGQHRAPLDADGIITIMPDIVWRRAGRIRAVFDAKYKVVHSDSYPNADIYQMLAYCIRHGVPDGHLVYADGDALPRVIDVLDGAGRTAARVHAHRLDLSRPPQEIEAQVYAIAAAALGGR